MSQTLSRMQQRGGRSSDWTALNPVLKAGEFGYETDTGKLKLGDGAAAWNVLPYQLAQGPAGPTGATGPTGPQGADGTVPKVVVMATVFPLSRNTTGPIATFTIPANTFKTNDGLQILSVYSGPNAGLDNSNYYTVGATINNIALCTDSQYKNEATIYGNANPCIYMVSGTQIIPSVPGSVPLSPITFDPTVSNTLKFSATRVGTPSYSVVLISFALLRYSS